MHNDSGSVKGGSLVCILLLLHWRLWGLFGYGIAVFLGFVYVWASFVEVVWVVGVLGGSLFWI